MKQRKEKYQVVCAKHAKHKCSGGHFCSQNNSEEHFRIRVGTTLPHTFVISHSVLLMLYQPKFFIFNFVFLVTVQCSLNVLHVITFPSPLSVF